MKKWCVILAITLSAVLCACQQKTIQESRAESMEEAMEKSVEESNGAGITFSEAPEQDAPIPYGETVTFSGYQLQDGASVAVTVSMKIGDVLRGEEAYAVLLDNDPQLPDSIYNCTIRAGESAEGKAAFLHGVGENEPLVFAGFERRGVLQRKYTVGGSASGNPSRSNLSGYPYAERKRDFGSRADQKAGRQCASDFCIRL